MIYSDTQVVVKRELTPITIGLSQGDDSFYNDDKSFLYTRQLHD